jgi:mannosyltransferase
LWAPWLPVFRYQSQRTATPWTERGDLLDILDTTFRWNRTELAGGLLLMVFAAAIIAALAYGRPVWNAPHLPRWAITLVAVVSLVIAALGGSLSGSAYVGRYTSIAFPAAVLMAGVGIASIQPRRLIAVVLVPVWALGVGYTIDEIGTPRTRATPIAEALLPRVRPGDAVVYCPDQLGPATSRLLDRSTAMAGTTQMVFPGGAPPGRVDWVDYAKRYRAARPTAFAATVTAQVGTGSVWLIVSTTYPATQQACQDVLNALLRLRPNATRLVADDVDIADHGALWRFEPSRYRRIATP